MNYLPTVGIPSTCSTCGVWIRQALENKRNRIEGSGRLDVHRVIELPSGKLTKSYGKSPFLMGKSTISMAIFNSKLLVYQRVFQRWWIPPKKNGIKSWSSGHEAWWFGFGIPHNPTDSDGHEFVPRISKLKILGLLPSYRAG